ncbi:MAG: PIN domain nuclease [Actinobacteria bacterium]|nr:PIN domain nuclease [Actinomycetota bacterium]
MAISKSLKKIVADANVILSAIIGKGALKVFTETSLEIVTTQFNLQEVKEYLPKLAAKYGLEEEILQTQLKLLPLKVYEANFYKDYLGKASKKISQRDPEDVDVLALSLTIGVPIWSNDKDFKKIG